MRLRKMIKSLLPPVIFKICNGLNFKGNYSSWEQAKKSSIGYDSDIVIVKAKESMLKVKNGEYAFAQDSVLFDTIQYSFPVLAGLLRVALANNRELSVLDFGGSLGSSYYQCREFLGDLKKITWSIVEQPKFVACGKKFFENMELRFYYSIDECCKNEKPNVILLSGVIQYIEEPYGLLEDILRRNFDYLIFDRTSFLKNGPDRLAIQKAPAYIYNCSYPIWFFNYDKFIAKLLSRYALVTAFDGFDKAEEPLFFKGFILKLK